MAYIKEFRIQNFKGIEDITINMAGRHKSPVITLVGLNESGKTTILEALSNFVTRKGTVAIGTDNTDSNSFLSLVPITKKANFSGKISISALVAIEETDIQQIKSIFEDKKLEIDDEKLKDDFLINRAYVFADGKYIETENSWDLEIFCKSKRATSFKEYERPEDSNDEDDLWLKAANLIQKTLPLIAYFPTFLVDVPSRIYLEAHTDEHASQKYYREVLQDILDSLGEGLSLKNHIIKRIRDYKEKEANTNWLSIFFGKPEKGQIDSVIQKISSAISKEVIGSWQNIFNRPISAKLIKLDWHVDSEKGDIPYISISISDGESLYALHERSLGFRWFFLFLLFTRFKGDKKRPTLFLFDEPAANLHARAQTELLASFEKIIGHQNFIIYSTHSAHMINPAWVPAAYIVENEAINYDSEDMGSFSTPPTSVLAHPYRQFVSNNPERTSYFQPILEKLEYIAPNINPENPIILTEGISDFHAFTYYCKDKMKSAEVSLLPGTGSGSHDIQISTLIGKGHNFIVLLDDDEAGKRNANRYKEEWLLNDNQISTLGELDQKYSGKKLETILSSKTLENIKKHFSENKGTPSKKEIGMFYSEANATLANDDCVETKQIFDDLLDGVIKRLASN